MATPTSKTYNEGARCNLLDSILRLVILEMICMRICVAILGGQAGLEPKKLDTYKLITISAPVPEASQFYNVFSKVGVAKYD